MLLIGNGRLVTRDHEHPFYEDGAVVLDGTTIKEVGDTPAMKEKYPEAEFIDAKHGTIMPAFINTHEHAYSAMARGLAINGYDPKGFLDILDGMWWTIDRNLDNELTYLSGVETFMENVRNGCTTVFDHHASFGEIEGSLFELERAAKECGVRASLCYETSDRDGKDKAQAAIKENVEFIKHAQKDTSDMIDGMFGMHASFTLSDETLAQAASEIPSGAGYHIHVAEGIYDLQQCLKEHGKRILPRLYDFGILDPQSLIVHCIYIDANEMQLLKDTDTPTTHNPESNMGNACGCPPTMQMMHKGVLCGLGTDGYTHDMTESYKVANVLHKHSLCDPNAAWAEAPQMLFEGNAQIANRHFKAELGVLRPGAAADVIVTDYIPNTPMDETNVNGHILFGVSGKSVVTTIANGKVLMKDREFTTIDEQATKAHIREGAARLAKKINSR